ncbi:MAG: hypothetical protein GY861_01855 [bacterium]|nr:hypothetical protein [bacterium]
MNDRPMLFEAMQRGIVSYGALAEKLRDEVALDLGHSVKESAIIMALRRYHDEIVLKQRKQFKFELASEITMKTNLVDVSVLKSPNLFIELEKLHKMVNYEKGDTLNIIHGSYEVSVVVSEKYMEKIKKLFDKEKILNIEKGLVSVSLRFGDEFLHTPGILFSVTRKLAWDNVNILEVVSTNTELTFIVRKKDAARAYTSLQTMVQS